MPFWDTSDPNQDLSWNPVALRMGAGGTSTPHLCSLPSPLFPILSHFIPFSAYGGFLTILLKLVGPQHGVISYSMVLNVDETLAWKHCTSRLTSLGLSFLTCLESDYDPFHESGEDLMR